MLLAVTDHLTLEARPMNRLILSNKRSSNPPSIHSQSQRLLLILSKTKVYMINAQSLQLKIHWRRARIPRLHFSLSITSLPWQWRT